MRTCLMGYESAVQRRPSLTSFVFGIVFYFVLKIYLGLK